jgi:hypothetical protein
VLLALAGVFAFFPRVLVYPLVLLFAWFAIALMLRAYKLHRQNRRRAAGSTNPRANVLSASTRRVRGHQVQPDDRAH